MTMGSPEFTSPVRARARRLAAVLCASALLAGAAAGPADPHAPDKTGTIPPGPVVANAAMQGDTAALRKLVAGGANVNVAQGDGMTALHWAAERGDVSMANLLIRARANLKAATRNGGYTPLHVASKDGNAAVVRALIGAGSDVNAMTATGATALHLAAASGSADAVTALLDKGADVNAKESEWGQTPLLFAAEYDRADVIRVLLKRGADANAHTTNVSLNDEAARDQAAQKKRNEVLVSFMPQERRDSVTAAMKEAAVKAAANPALAGGRAGGGGRGGGTMQPVGPFTPAQVQAAIDSGRAVMLTAAVAKGPVQEVVDTINGGVVGYAASIGGIGGLTALHHAVRQGSVNAVLALLDGGANVNDASLTDHTTPLLLATINGQFDVAIKLIERGADPNIASSAGATPLYAALNTEWAPRSRFPQPQAVQNQKTSYLEMMTALLKAHANPNVRIQTHLWYFAFNNCGNANCGLENLEGTTPFWRAAYATDVDAMRLLIGYGADPDVPSQRTAVGGRGGRVAGGAGGGRGAAGAGGSPKVLPAVVSDGRTDVTTGPDGGAAPPARAGRGAIPGPRLDPVVDSAARAAVPGLGVYALHAASGVGFGNGFAGNSLRHAPDGWMPSVKYLVEVLHADVNIRDQNGYTPLHNAAARGDNEMILYLVSKGADVKAVAKNGRTTVDMANSPVSRTRPFPETIALLEKLGAHNSHNCVSCW